VGNLEYDHQSLVGNNDHGLLYCRALVGNLEHGHQSLVGNNDHRLILAEL